MPIRLSAFVLLACCLHAQPSKVYQIETVAGTLPDDEGVAAVSAILSSPQALAIGKDGVIYVGGLVSGIRKITPDGIITHVPGTVFASTGLTVTANGSLYSVFGGPELYRWDPNTATTTTSRPTDGVFRPGRLAAVASDANGNVLVADQDQTLRRVLRVSPTGEVSVAAGLGSRVPLNGPPLRLAVDGVNNIYIALTNSIIRISPDGAVTLVAGSGASGSPIVEGPAAASPLNPLGAIAANKAGAVYFVDRFLRKVLKVNSAGLLELVAQDMDIFDLAIDPAGNLLGVDPNGRIWQLQDDGSREIIAGREQFDGDGGPATQALLKSPRAVALDSTGALFIGDSGNNRIRKVTPDGTITTVAGNGVAGFAGDGGPAAEAQIAGPELMVIDNQDNLYFATQGYRKIRRIRRDGTIETVAGTGESGDSGDNGPATAATFRTIDGLAVDGEGRLFVSDRTSNRVRVITADGKIAAFAGNGERAESGPVDAAKPALTEPLAGPSVLATDARGNLVIYESIFSRLRLVSTSGMISKLAFPGLNAVLGMGFDQDGSLLVTGYAAGNVGVIYRFLADGTSSLAAGTSGAGSIGDGGPALSAILQGPTGLTVSSSGDIFFADTGNHRIRRLRQTGQGDR